jgi:hypothetical protein
MMPDAFRHLLVLFIFLSGTDLLAAYQTPPLQRYTCLTEHLDIAGYEDPELTTYVFDSLGGIRSKEGFHPVLASIYSIMCHHLFTTKGDSSYYWKFCRQVENLLDTSAYDVLNDGRAIAYAYRFTYFEHTPPWYSGMAQGLVLSVLLRYMELHPEADLDDHCRRVAWFMMLPEKEGGTLGAFPDGSPFIEEYPRAKSSKQVLNGGINAFIGLYEYSLHFPDDFRAALLVRRIFKGIIDNFKHYTLPGWCRYDLGTKSVSNSYMRYHLYQLQHLHELSGRDALIAQQAIWASVFLGKKIERNAQIFSHPNHFLAVKPVPTQYGWRIPDYPLEAYVAEIDPGVKMATAASVDELSRLLPSGAELPFASGKKRHFLLYQLPRDRYAGLIHFAHAASVRDPEIHVMDARGQVCPTQAHATSRNFTQATVDEKTENTGIRYVLISAGQPIAVDRITDELALFDTRDWRRPWWATYVTRPRQLEAGVAYKVDLPRQLTGGLRVFHRRADDTEHLSIAIFMHEKQLRDSIFRPSRSGLHEFLVAYRVEDLRGAVGELKLTPVDE